MIEQKNNIISKGCTLGVTHINSPISFMFLPSIDPVISQSMTGDPIPGSIVKNAPYISMLFGSDVFNEEFFQEIDRAIKVFGGFLPIRCEELTELLIPMDENIALYAGVGTELLNLIDEDADGVDTAILKDLQEKSRSIEVDEFIQLLSSSTSYLETYSSVFFKNYTILFNVVSRTLTVDNNITYYNLVIEPVDMFEYFNDGIMKFLINDYSVIDQEVLKRYSESYGTTLMNPKYASVMQSVVNIFSNHDVYGPLPREYEGYVTPTEKNITIKYTKDPNNNYTINPNPSRISSIPFEYATRLGDVVNIRAFQSNGSVLKKFPLGMNTYLATKSVNGLRLSTSPDYTNIEISKLFKKSIKLTGDTYKYEFISVDDGDTLEFASNGTTDNKTKIRVLGVDSFETPKFKLNIHDIALNLFDSSDDRVYDLHMSSIYNALRDDLGEESPIFKLANNKDTEITNTVVYFDIKTDNNTVEISKRDTDDVSVTKLDDGVSDPAMESLMYYAMSIVAGHKLFDHMHTTNKDNDGNISFTIKDRTIYYDNENEMLKSYDRNVGYIDSFAKSVVYDTPEVGFIAAAYSTNDYPNNVITTISDDAEYRDKLKYSEYESKYFDQCINNSKIYIENKLKNVTDTSHNNIIAILQSCSPIHLTTYLYALAYNAFVEREGYSLLVTNYKNNICKYMTQLSKYNSRHFTKDCKDTTVHAKNFTHTNGTNKYSVYIPSEDSSNNDIKLYESLTHIHLGNWTIDGVKTGFGPILFSLSDSKLKNSYDSYMPKLESEYLITSSIVETSSNNAQSTSKSMSLTRLFDNMFAINPNASTTFSFPNDVSLTVDPEQLLEIATSLTNNSTIYAELSTPYRKLVNSIYEPMYADTFALKYTYPSELGEDDSGENEYYPLLGLNNNTYAKRNAFTNNDLLIHYSALNTINKNVQEAVRDTCINLLYSYVPNNLLPVMENYKINQFYYTTPPHYDGTTKHIYPNTQIMDTLLKNTAKYYTNTTGYEYITVGHSSLESLINIIFSDITNNFTSGIRIKMPDIHSYTSSVSARLNATNSKWAKCEQSYDVAIKSFTVDNSKLVKFSDLYDSMMIQLIYIIDICRLYLVTYYNELKNSNTYDGITDTGTQPIQVFDTVISHLIDEYCDFKTSEVYTQVLSKACSDEVSHDQFTECTPSQVAKLINESDAYTQFMYQYDKIEIYLRDLYNISNKLYIPKTLAITNSTITSITGIDISYSSNNVTLKSSQTGIGTQKQYVNSSTEHVSIKLQTKDSGLIRSLLLLYYTNDVNAKAIMGIDKSRTDTTLNSYKNITMFSGVEEQLTDMIDSLRSVAKQNFDFTVLLQNNLLNAYGIKSGFITDVSINMLDNRVGEYEVNITILRSTPRYKQLSDLKANNLSPFRNVTTEYLIANVFDDDFDVNKINTNKGELEFIHSSTSWIAASMNNIFISALTLITTIGCIELASKEYSIDDNDICLNNIKSILRNQSALYTDLIQLKGTELSINEKCKYDNSPSLILYSVLSLTHGLIEGDISQFNMLLNNLNTLLSRLSLIDKQQMTDKAKSGVFNHVANGTTSKTYRDLMKTIRDITKDLFKTLPGMNGNNTVMERITDGDAEDFVRSIIDEFEIYTSKYDIEWAINLRLYILELLHANKEINVLYGTAYGKNYGGNLDESVAVLEYNTKSSKYKKSWATIRNILSSSRTKYKDISNSKVIDRITRIRNAYGELHMLNNEIIKLNNWDAKLVGDDTYQIKNIPNSILKYAYSGENGVTSDVTLKWHPQLIRKVHSIYTLARSYGYLNISELKKEFDTTNADKLKHENPIVTILIEFFYELYRSETHNEYMPKDRDENIKIKDFICGKLVYFDILAQMLFVTDSELGHNFNMIKYMYKGADGKYTHKGGLRAPSLREPFISRSEHVYNVYSCFLIRTLNNSGESWKYNFATATPTTKFTNNKLVSESHDKLKAKLYDSETTKKNLEKVSNSYTIVNTKTETKSRDDLKESIYNLAERGIQYNKVVTHNYKQLNLTNIYQLFTVTLFGSSFNIVRAVSEEVYSDYISPVVMGSTILEHHNIVSKDVYYLSSSSLMFGNFGVNSPMDMSNFDLGYYMDSKLPKCYIFEKGKIFDRMNDMIVLDKDKKKSINTVIYSIYEQLLMGSKTCTYPYFFILDDKLISNVASSMSTFLYSISSYIGEQVDAQTSSNEAVFRKQIETSMSTLKKTLDENSATIKRLQSQLRGSTPSTTEGMNAYNQIDNEFKKIFANQERISQTINTNVKYTSTRLDKHGMDEYEKYINSSGGTIKGLSDKIQNSKDIISTQLGVIHIIATQGTSQTYGANEHTSMANLGAVIQQIIDTNQHTIDVTNIYINLGELLRRYIEYSNNKGDSAKKGDFVEFMTDYSSIISGMNKNITATAITNHKNSNIGHKYYNEVLSAISRTTSSISKMFPTFKIIFYNDDIKELMTFEDSYIFSRVVSYTISNNIASPCSELMLEIDDPFDDLSNVQSITENRQLYGINPYRLTSLDKLDTSKFALSNGTNIQIRSGYSTHLDDDSIIFNGKVTSVQGDGFGSVSISALSHGSSLSTPLENRDLEVISADDLSFGKVSFREGTPGGVQFIHSLYELNPSAFSGVNMKSAFDSFMTDTPIKKQNHGDEYASRYIVPSMYMSKLGITKNITTDNIYVNVNPFRMKDNDANKLLYRTPDSVWSTLKEIQLHYQNNKLLVRPFDSKETMVFMPSDSYYLKSSRNSRSMVNTNIAINNTDTTYIATESILRKSARAIDRLISSMNTSKNTSERRVAYELGLYLISMYDLNIGTNSDSSTNILNTINSINFLNVDPNSAPANGVIEKVISKLTAIKGEVDKVSKNEDDSRAISVPLTYVMVNFLGIINDFLKSISKSYRKVSMCHYKHNSDIIAINIDQLYNSNGVSLTFLDDAETKDEANDGTYLAKLAASGIEKGMRNLAYGENASSNIAAICNSKTGDELRLNGITSGFAKKLNNLVPFSNIGRKVSNLHESNWWKTRNFILTDQIKLDDRRFVTAEHANVVMFKLCDGYDQDHYKIVASSIMNNVLNEYYGGLITMYGDPNIMVGDRILVSDAQTSTYGTVEVRELLHNFDAHTGFTTTAVPSMIAYSNVDDINIGGGKALSDTGWLRCLGTHGLDLAIDLFLMYVSVGTYGSIMGAKWANWATAGAKWASTIPQTPLLAPARALSATTSYSFTGLFDAIDTINEISTDERVYDDDHGGGWMFLNSVGSVFDLLINQLTNPLATAVAFIEDDIIDPFKYGLTHHPLDNIIIPIHKKGVPMVPNINLYPRPIKSDDWLSIMAQGYIHNNYGVDMHSTESIIGSK